KKGPARAGLVRDFISSPRTVKRQHGRIRTQKRKSPGREVRRLGPGQGWDSQSQATRRMRFQQHSDCKILLPRHFCKLAAKRGRRGASDIRGTKRDGNGRQWIAYSAFCPALSLTARPHSRSVATKRSHRSNETVAAPHPNSLGTNSRKISSHFYSSIPVA